jgi:peptide/nickel transport system substrate-binding protein
MSTEEQHGTGRRRSPLSTLCRAAVVGAMALLVTAGLATPLDPGAPRAMAADDGKQVLTAAVAQSVDSLNPFLATRLVSTSVLRLMYEYLTDYDVGDGHTVPGLATKWTPSADKLTWTYTIRSDATWSDGRRITAEDAAWTFRTMMTTRRRPPRTAVSSGTSGRCRHPTPPSWSSSWRSRRPP